jgi:hypothetical protein
MTDYQNNDLNSKECFVKKHLFELFKHLLETKPEKFGITRQQEMQRAALLAVRSLSLLHDTYTNYFSKHEGKEGEEEEEEENGRVEPIFTPDTVKKS